MTGTPGRIARRAPQLGEHTDLVLGELGDPQFEIDRLRQQHVAVYELKMRIERIRRPRRVQLSTPGSSERMIAEAASSNADHASSTWKMRSPPIRRQPLAATL